MKVLSKFSIKLLRIVAIFSIVIQGLNNKYLIKRGFEEQLNDDLVELDSIVNIRNKLDIIPDDSWKDLLDFIEKTRKNKSNFRHLLLENNIKIKLNSNQHILFPKIKLEIEFGNSVNPLYYNSINSFDYCLLLLSKHFQTHMRNSFEIYLEKVDKIKSETHEYINNSKYYLELKSTNNEDIKFILGYISLFFKDNIFNTSKLINHYLLDLQIHGNKYFMPDNFIKQLFLTVLNDQFYPNNIGIQNFNDIYADIKNCAKRNKRLLSTKYKHVFKKEIKNIEITVNESQINLNRLEKFVKHSFKRLKIVDKNFNYMNIFIKKHPFLTLTRGILQINNNRVTNKLVFVFPIKEQIYYQKYRISKILDDIFNKNSLFRKSIKKYVWIKNINFEFEYNHENKFSNLIINFYSIYSLNSEDVISRFNLIQIIEIWLRTLLLFKKELEYKIETFNSNKIKNYNLNYYAKLFNYVEYDFIHQFFSSLDVINMLIVIYSNNPITIKGVDVINMNNKIRETYYYYFIRKYHALSYFIRKKLLPIFGIKYLINNEEYYFGTKYLYEKIPSSIISYISENYEVNFR